MDVIGDHNWAEIVLYLDKLDRRQIIILGGELGLNIFNLEKRYTLPDDMVTAWLRKEDDVIKKCGHPLTWSVLVKALQRMGQTGIAGVILRDKIELNPLQEQHWLESQSGGASVMQSLSHLRGQILNYVPSRSGVVTLPSSAPMPTIDIREIHVQARSLGSGAYGSVMEVEYRSLHYAAKFFNRKKEEMDEDFKKEVEILSQLHHDHIVRYIGIAYNPKPVLVMELLKTSLHDHLEEKPNLATTKMFHILHDVTKGLNYLHQQDVIHRDLTAKNVLLDDNDVAKIADFGNSRMIKIDSYAALKTMTKEPGNVYYCAPETFVTMDTDKTRYNHQVDCFSFGHLSIFVVLEELPFRELVGADNDSPLKRREKYIDRVKTKLGARHQLVILIETCLSECPSDRPTSSYLQRELGELCTEEEAA